MDESLRCHDNSPLPFTYGNASTTGQKKAKIGTGKYRASRATRNLMNVEPCETASYPSAELPGRMVVRQELAEWNVR
jgi:hypothetical protein